MTQRVFIAGHRGMVGSALCRQLVGRDDVELVTASRNELDLTDQRAVHTFLAEEAIDQVYLAAAKVGVFTPTTAIPRTSSTKTS